MLITFTFIKLVINFKTNKMKTKIFMLVALFATTISFSQTNNNANYINTFMYKAKPGMVEKFEKAAAKKTKMYNGDNNPMLTYKVLTGNNAGAYRRYNVNQSISDYNQDASDEQEYWNKNVMPYGEVVYSQTRWQRYSWGNQGDQTRSPYKFITETFYTVKPGHVSKFNTFQARVGQVFTEAYPSEGRAVVRLVSGGNRYLFIVFNGFDDYGNESQIDSNFQDRYNSMFGINQWDVDLDDFLSSLDYFGSNANSQHTLQFIPELSTNMGN